MIKKIGLLIPASLLVFLSLFFSDIKPVSADSANCINLNFRSRYGFVDYGTYREVISIETFLSAAGYLKEMPDGYFDFPTVAALQAFQKANGLEEFGYASPETRAKIKELSCASTSPIIVPPAEISVPQTLAEALQIYIDKLIKKIADALGFLPVPPSASLPGAAPAVTVVAPAGSENAPSITLAADKPLSSNGQIVLKKGSTIKFTATARNLTAGYSRAFFYDQNFGNCTLLDWDLTCVAEKLGFSQFSVEFTENFATYRSNPVAVNVIE